MKQIPPLDAVWLALESRDTPMHVGGLFEFTLPKNAPADYLKLEFERMREARAIPSPWNLKLVEPPLLGGRAPLRAAPSRRPARARNPRLTPAQPPARSAPATLGGASDRGARREPLCDVQQDSPLADRRRQRDASDHARALQGPRSAWHGLVLDRRRGRTSSPRRRPGRRAGSARAPAQRRSRRRRSRRRAFPRGV